MTDTLTFATRPSALARWQTGWVIEALRKAWPDLECREKIITTSGDRIIDRPLPEIGGKGLFTQELETELLTAKVHAAVHSLKDLPVQDTPGLKVSAIPQRADPRDVLISAEDFDLDTLPTGALVGTSSLRRSAQLLAYRSDLRTESLRGNIDTRIRKAREGQYDAIILAGAGVSRLGLLELVRQWLPLDVMLPAPGQGALAVQSREIDGKTTTYLSAIDDYDTRSCVTAERAFLEGLGGGCSLPVAAHAVVKDGLIELIGLIASLDGKQLVRVKAEGKHPETLGKELAETALADGAAEILGSVKNGSRA